MQTSSSDRNEPELNHDFQNRPSFNIVIVYEDFTAGKHAKETYDYLASQLGVDYEFTNQMWKFDVLGNSKMRGLAVKDATTADLIVISTHGMGDLPAGVTAWIEEWLAQPRNAMALVTLVDRPHIGGDEFAGVRAYLQDVARKAGMDFFAQPDDWPDRDEDFSTEQIAERAQQTSAIMADLIQHTAPAARWGINE